VEISLPLCQLSHFPPHTSPLPPTKPFASPRFPVRIMPLTILCCLYFLCSGEEAFYPTADTLGVGEHKDSEEGINRMVEDLEKQYVCSICVHILILQYHSLFCYKILRDHHRHFIWPIIQQYAHLHQCSWSRTARSNKITNRCPKTCHKTVTVYIFYHTSKILQTRKLEASIFSMLFIKTFKDLAC